VLVAAVLRPEHAEDGKLEVVRSPPEQFLDALELLVGEAEGAVQGLERLLGDCRQTASLAPVPDSPPGGNSSGRGEPRRMPRYASADWEHGLACLACRRVLREGDRYSERLTAFAEDMPMVELICLECATATAPLPAAPRS
jgi:hypothetical protein